MYFLKSKQHNNFCDPSYIDEIISKQYKDTPFSIIKEKIGKMWTVYIIIEIPMLGETYITAYMQYWTKREAIEDIESGNIIKSINKEFHSLQIIHNYLNQH